jgi:acetyl esterase/lipase
MTRSEFLFLAIDKLCYPSQNYRRYKDVTREKNIVYDSRYPNDCTAEIYYDPKLVGTDKPKLPVVLNIHGGGFVKGDKSYRKSLCSRYAHHGYFVFNINNRVSPKYKFPDACIDCIHAINFLSELAGKYNIDLDKVCMTGDSSGAYFATQTVSLYASDEQRERIGAPAFTVKPALLVSFCGPYDLVKSISLTKLPFHVVWDIGRCYLDTPPFRLKKDFTNLGDYENLDCLSPINWVNRNWCPSFLVMSPKDVFCKGQGELLKAKLDVCGVENAVFSSTKFVDNHCFHLNFWTKISKSCFKAMFEFMDKHLKIEQNN